MNHVTSGDSRLLGKGPRGLVSSFVLSYLLAALVYATLVYAGGIWNLLANSRVLDLLLRGGIVQLTDADAGFIPGIPDVKYYIASQDPLDWGLLLLAAGLFCLFWGIKSLQFNEFSRFVGIEGSFGTHARAYLYGGGLNRFLPFRAGDAATGSALQHRGASAAQAGQAVYLTRLALVFEVAVFSLIGLFMVGFSFWLMLLAWSLVILGAAAYLRYGLRGETSPRAAAHRGWQRARATALALVREPAQATKLAVLSLIAFGLKDVIAYVIAMAFSSENIIIHPEPGPLLMAIVAGHIARLVPVTPGGIGQFEWGFAAALYLAGMGIPEAVTLAILYNLVRYVTGTLVWGGLTLGYGADTDLPRTFAVFTRQPATETNA